jgi:hypothetical protein
VGSLLLRKSPRFPRGAHAPADLSKESALRAEELLTPPSVRRYPDAGHRTIIRCTLPAYPSSKKGMGLTMMKRLMGSLLLLCCVGCASQSSILVSGAIPGQRVVKTQRMILWGLIESDKTWDPRTQ